jgi:trans-aconitate methyltransferase
MTSSPLVPLAATTLGVYEHSAKDFDKQRNKNLFERGWLDKFLRHVPLQGHILDVGCGSGEPIASYLGGQGRNVTGVDGAASMVALARQKFPEGTWHQMDMRSLDMGAHFDGVIAWNSFFHLTRPDQRRVLPLLVKHLKPCGPLMFTVGTSDGEVTGQVAGQTVYHASLSPETYEEILASHGCEVIDFVLEDPSCNHHSILLARKKVG